MQEFENRIAKSVHENFSNNYLAGAFPIDRWEALPN